MIYVYILYSVVELKRHKLVTGDIIPYKIEQAYVYQHIWFDLKETLAFKKKKVISYLTLTKKFNYYVCREY